MDGVGGPIKGWMAGWRQRERDVDVETCLHRHQPWVSYMAGHTDLASYPGSLQWLPSSANSLLYITETTPLQGFCLILQQDCYPCFQYSGWNQRYIILFRSHIFLNDSLFAHVIYSSFGPHCIQCRLHGEQITWTNKLSSLKQVCDLQFKLELDHTMLRTQWW